jgi:hypothetical protein
MRHQFAVGNPYAQMGAQAAADRRNVNKLFSRAVSAIMAEKDPARGKHRAMEMALKFYDMAMRGNVFAGKVLIERLEGAVKQDVTLHANSDQPLNVVSVNMPLDQLAAMYRDSLLYDGDDTTIEHEPVQPAALPAPRAKAPQAANGHSRERIRRK